MAWKVYRLAREKAAEENSIESIQKEASAFSLSICASQKMVCALSPCFAFTIKFFALTFRS